MSRYDCHFVGIEHLYLYCDFVLFWPDLRNILQQFYDNAIVTIDLRRMSNLPKNLSKNARLFLDTIYLQNRKIVGDNVSILACDIPNRNLGTL